MEILMIKANAFIQTDTLILLASAIALTAFVYFNSTNELDSASTDEHIRPIGTLVVTHNPADASGVLQQLESLNALNTNSNEQNSNETTTEHNSINNALASAVSNAITETALTTVQEPIPAPITNTTTNTRPQPTGYRPYYGTPFPMPVYQMPPPVNPYRYQYGYAPYPTHR